MTTSPCDSLSGRLRDICTGGAGISPVKRRAYIDRWLSTGRLAADPDTHNESASPADQNSSGSSSSMTGAVPARKRKPARKKPATEPAPTSGPGTELHAMLENIGIRPSAHCPCRKMARKMDRWGVEGCRQNRQEIIDHIQQQMDARGWADKLAAASRAAVSGLAFRLNPLDIPGSLVDEAIRRAEVTSRSASAGSA